MNQMWKRVMSLALSGVLLVGSLPVQVWAEQGDGDAGGSAPETYVKINGDSLEAVGLTVTEGMLTLDSEKNITVQTIEIKGQPLIINVVGKNEIDAGGAVAITTDSDLTITGEGSLVVTSDNATAIYVASAGANAVDKNILTIDGVQLSVDTAYQYVAPEDSSSGNGAADLPLEPIGIDAADGVVIQGAAHFRTSHNAAETAYTLDAGFVKTTAEGQFAEVVIGSNPVKGVLEFVGEDHLEWVYASETQHELYCKEPEEESDEEPCALADGTVFASTGHSVGETAGCGKSTKCKACKGYYGDVVEAHKGTVALTPVDGEERHIRHIQKYSECGHTVGEAEEHVYDIVVVSEDKTALTVECECGAVDESQSVSLAAPTNLIWNDNEEKKATVNLADTTINYYIVDKTGSKTPMPADTYPTNPGEYVAEVEVEIGGESYVLEVSYSIQGKVLTDTMVTLSKDFVTYDGGLHQMPTVTVTGLTEETDYEVTFTRNGTAVSKDGEANAGDITVTVTGKGNYSGTVTKIFKINQAEATASLFSYTPPSDLTYNGQAKTVAIGAENGVQGMGDIEIRYYRNGTLKESCIDAGDYEARVYVEGTGNYAKKEIQNNWTFTITAADVGAEGVCTVNVESQQTVGTGLGDFKGPASFTGYTKAGAEEADKLTGNVTYTYDKDKTTQDITVVREHLSKLDDGDTEVIGYTFIPTGNNNYKGSKTGEIAVTKTTLTVKNNGVPGTPEEVGEDIKRTDPKYGDPWLVDVTNLSAHIGEASDSTDANFTVKYAKYNNGAYADPVAMEKPDAGSYKFYVYYNNSNLGGVSVKDAVVATGDINIGKKTSAISDANKPKPEVLVDNGTAQPLLKAGKEGKTDDYEALEYSLTENGTYSTTIPTVEEGKYYYEVWYRSPSGENYSTPVKDKVQVLVLPVLEATYGDTLLDVENAIKANPKLAGFTINKNALSTDLDKVSVGTVGAPLTVELNYENSNGYTKSAQKVKLKVLPKELKKDDVVVTLNADVYDRNKDKYVRISDAEQTNLFIFTVGDKVLEYKKDYTTTTTGSEDGLTGYQIFKTVDGGNYKFVPLSDKREDAIYGEVKLYRVGRAELTKDNFPEDLLDGSDYATLDKAKKALTDKLKEDAYPEEYMKFFKVYLMKQTGARVTDNIWTEYTPEDMSDFNGFTYEIPLDELFGAKDTDKFKVALIYLAGDNAGDPIELDADDYATTTSGDLKINNLKREAIVCVAKKVDLTTKYNINKAFVYNDKTSTTNSYGKLVISVDGKSSTTATYGKTVKLTVTANSSYDVKAVTVINEKNGKAISHKQNSSNYEFSMPDSHVTVKVEYYKKPSTGKNPSSGDTSNIYLWAGVLGVSTAALVALLAIWFWKRRK